MSDPFRNPESERALRIARALMGKGLLTHARLDEAYDVICGVLSVCQYCQTVLLPNNDPIYCDTTDCVVKAMDGLPPEDDSEGQERSQAVTKRSRSGTRRYETHRNPTERRDKK